MNNTIPRIIIKNVFTLFNLVILILAIMVISVGSYKNLLFVFIAFFNTIIGIMSEIKAKRVIDKLRLISEQRPTVIRNEKPYQIPPEEVVRGDIISLNLGDQILFDCKVISGSIEVNEAFVTGEQSNIAKKLGDPLISGSFVISGSALAKVEKTSRDSFIAKLEKEAHTVKTADSKLFRLINNIVKYISILLIPIGALLLLARFNVPHTTPEVAVTSTVAALINMIPSGLVLLITSVLALAATRLGKKHVLVQDFYSIETLARVDTFCLDKTGTLTTGKMKVHDYIETSSKNALVNALELILSHVEANNATSKALARKFLKNAKNGQKTAFSYNSYATSNPRGTLAHNSYERVADTSGFGTVSLAKRPRACPEDRGTDRTRTNYAPRSPRDYKLDQAVSSVSEGLKVQIIPYELNGEIPKTANFEVIPFSSDRKYSGLICEGATFLMGALEFMTKNPDFLKLEKEISESFRVISVLKRSKGREELLGFVRLEDEIRKNAPEIIDFFYKNDIEPKIISGDNLSTILPVADRVGLKDPKGIDLSGVKRPNYAALVKEYNVFARVVPSQKKELILALKRLNHTIAMTGDGINDILALKEADCSIAIGDGSDAARRTSKIVLLNSDFSVIKDVIAEGRGSINNLERSTALFLAKTVYAIVLAVLFVFLPLEYPFSPIEMSLLNFACIGFPGLVLSLEKNTDRIKNKFVSNIIEYSIPIGLTVSLSMLALAIVSHFQEFSRSDMTTTAVFITFTINLILIYQISRPLNRLRATLLLSVIGIMLGAFLIPFSHDLFEFTFLNHYSLITMAIIIAVAVPFFHFAHLLAHRLSSRFEF
ncbi:MAG: HAD-IC family P-type ATPase [Candidatus Saccharibacteria bacterium]|nr:HAD-IC family P-type ATPase [Candidatus Saccharibacteria bacterium]